MWKDDLGNFDLTSREEYLEVIWFIQRKIFYFRLKMNYLDLKKKGKIRF